MGLFWNIFNKKHKENNLLQIFDKLDKNYKQLKENVYYGQQIVKTCSWTYYVKTKEIYFTDVIYQLLECSPEDLDNKMDNFYKYIHPEDVEEVKNSLEGTLMGKDYEIQYRIITSQGEEIYVHEKSKILFDDNNNPVKVIGTIQDITNHKIVENDLKELCNNLEHAQRSAGIGNWIYDIANDSFSGTEEVYRIYNVEQVEFNKNFKGAVNLIHPEDKIKVENALKRHLEGESCSVDYRIPQQDGSVKYVTAIGDPLYNEDKQVIGVIGTIQDVTEKKLLEEELKKSYKNLMDAQKLAHIGSWEIDILNGKRYWSDELYRILGFKQKKDVNPFEIFMEFVHPEDKDLLTNILLDTHKELNKELEFRIIRPDGSLRYIYALFEITTNSDGKPIYLYGIAQDITEKKKLQNAINSKQEEINKLLRRFQVLTRESSDVFEIISPDGTIKYISEAAEKVIGYKPEERIGKKIFDNYNEKEILKISRAIKLVLKNTEKILNVDVEFKTKEGKIIYLEVNMQNLIHEPAIEGIVVNIKDITRRIEIKKLMLHKANHDELTGLPNRLYFQKQLKIDCQKADESQTRFALFMLDIDGLKYVSYLLGFDIGHQFVLSIVQRIKENLENAPFICRYSEDHFAIIVKNLKTIREYENLVQRIIGLFKKPFKVDNYELDAAVNIGISIYIRGKLDNLLLIKHAEAALLQAKKEGRNTYKFYSSDLDIQNYKEFVLRNDLHSAIEKGQLRVYYQPIVNIKTNELIAAEALIRWEHPDWGLVSPIEFISIAEETGLIIGIGKWILREVCNNYKKWSSNKLPAIKVSVNFSAIQFMENDFSNKISNIITEYELNPNFLIMEITESVLLKDSDHVVAEIQNLKSYGIEFALDDFGTGYSSFTYLNTFNIDYIKIDGSFIKNLQTDDASVAITRAIINLSKELKIKLIAEGIDDWNQLLFLKEYNCYSGQGYLYSKPVPLEDFEKILAVKKCRPAIVNNTKLSTQEDRRKYFRISFPHLLETDLTILKLKEKTINVGYTKVLVKNIGPGGLCFISNIKFPIVKDISLKFSMDIIETEIQVNGCPVWFEELGRDLYEYGIEFVIDESDRDKITKVLNQVLTKMRNNMMFSEGNFIMDSYLQYFSSSKAKH